MLNFDFLEKDLGPASPLQYAHDFQKKIFLMSYFINCPNFTVWLPLLLEIYGNMCILIICFPVYDVINLSFLIRPFSYMTKEMRTEI